MSQTHQIVYSGLGSVLLNADVHHQTVTNGKMIGLECVEIALQSFFCHSEMLVPGQVGDMAVSTFYEVFYHLEGPLPVVENHLCGPEIGQNAVHKDDGHAFRYQTRVEIDVAGVLSHRHNQPLYHARLEHLDVATLKCGRFIRLTNQHLIALRVEHFLDTDDDFGEEKRDELRHHDTNHIVAPFQQIASVNVGFIIQFASLVHHQVARMLTDLVATIERTRYRGNRDAECLSYIFDGGFAD